MGDYYLGEIRLFTYANGKVPHGWHICDGTVLPVSQYAALFAVLGAKYGGDGRTNFALPDLRGRVPVNAGHQPNGSAYVVGDKGGAEGVQLLAANLPIHTHQTTGSTANGATPAATAANKLFAKPASIPSHLPPAPLPQTPSAYAAAVPTQALAPSVVEPSGVAAAHNNMQPFVALTYGIAMTGVYPPRT